MRDRIKQLMLSEGLSPSELAGLVKVLPSSISHLLVGRNKPSFDFIANILQAFPTLNPYWLIMGQDPMYNDINSVAGSQQVQANAVKEANADQAPMHNTRSIDTNSGVGRLQANALPTENDAAQDSTHNDVSKGYGRAQAQVVGVDVPIKTNNGDDSRNNDTSYTASSSHQNIESINSESNDTMKIEQVIILLNNGKFKHYIPE